MLILSWYQRYPAVTHLGKARCRRYHYHVFIDTKWAVPCFLGMTRFCEVLATPWAFGRRTRWEFSIDINNQAWIKWFKPSSESISSTGFDWQDFDLHNLFLTGVPLGTRTGRHESLGQVVNSPEGTRLIICGVWTHTWVSAFPLAKGPLWSPCYGQYDLMTVAALTCIALCKSVPYANSTCSPTNNTHKSLILGTFERKRDHFFSINFCI